MVTPAKGDYASVPLTNEGRRVADLWDPARDGACEAYGAGGIMRMPTRVRISWETDSVLKLETDAGVQTRRFVFGTAPRSVGPRTLQGFSRAEWQLIHANVLGAGPAGGVLVPGASVGGSLLVTTAGMRAGWLRRNGVPYSENAVITEDYDRFPSQDGAEWFVVTTVVDDPVYLNQTFVTSSHFRREANDAAWSPAPCRP
jgi:hypothetical protein